jgi:hypothetical protein
MRQDLLHVVASWLLGTLPAGDGLAEACAESNVSLHVLPGKSGLRIRRGDDCEHGCGRPDGCSALRRRRLPQAVAHAALAT